MQQLAVRCLAFTVLVVAATACRTTLRAHATLPPGARVGPLIVFTRDLGLQGYKLGNAAELVAATPDSLSLSVRVVHGLDEVADPDRWTVTLEDDSGRALAPAARTGARRSRLSIEFKPVVGYSIARNVTELPRVEKLIPPEMSYQGDAVYRFDAAGLGVLALGRDLHLLVRRSDGVTLRYDWSFREGPVQVAHHGWTTTDTERGVLAVPGDVTRVASFELLR